ncbi:MAG: phage prohead protein, partial [Actinobacteria bacterium]|nr:phage prohead protein [Actinomycetota bacterium]
PREKQAYKLPHHELIDGELRVVWRGVASAMQVLLGARGGVDVPESDRKEVYRHLAEHYAEFGEEPPEFH